MCVPFQIIPIELNLPQVNFIRSVVTSTSNMKAPKLSASFIAPKEKLLCFTTIGQEELNKLINASKPTTCLLDPVPTKLLKELPVAEEPLLNIINSSLSLGHVPKPFKLAVIKPLVKKPQLDPSELANYRPISNLPFLSKIFEKVVCSIVLLLAKKLSLKNFSQVSGPAIAQKLHLLRLQITCFLRQTKAASHC